MWGSEMQRIPPQRRDDAGLTLIELMVAGLILSIVLLAIGGMLISILTTQRTVANVTQTTTTAQATATAIVAGVRNASDVRLTTPTGADQLLVVRTANSDDTISWSCRAWYYEASTGTIRSMTTPGARIPAPTAPQLADWAVVATDVTPRTGSGIFSVITGGIGISYNAEVSDGAPVAIQTSAIKRSGVAEVGSCY